MLPVPTTGQFLQAGRLHPALSLAGRGLPPPPGFEPVSEADTLQAIPSRLRQMARRHSRRPAVRTASGTLTYRELDRATDGVACALLGYGLLRGTPIGLLLDQNETSGAIGVVGALKSGFPYVPLDPLFPLERLRSVVEQSGTALLVADAPSAECAARLASEQGLPLLQLESPGSGHEEKPPEIEIGLDDPAYIFYTSGSTGRPKGVPQTHRNRLQNTRNFTNLLQISPEDRFSMLHSFGFSASASELFGALMAGACVCPYDVRRRGLAGLADWLDETEISVFQWIPSAMRAFAAGLEPTRAFPSVRILQLSSEPVTETEVTLFRRHFLPGSVLVNRYGTSETSIVAQFLVDHPSVIDGPLVPSGYPIPGKEILILDEQGAPCPPGTPGEIVVRSAFHSPGYWRAPELTAQRFRSLEGSDERLYFTGDLGRVRRDGCLEHLGRLDHQVKVRGHRVEVAVIEAALRRVEGICDAAVIARPAGVDHDPELHLVAYVVREASISPAELRTALASILPAGLLPGRFVFLPQLPTTPTGKIDRAALPDPGETRPELDQPYAPPETPLEAELCTLWAEVLGVRPVGRNDSFLELGGNSLRAARLLARVAACWGVRLAPVDLFARPTVVQTATAILCHAAEETGAPALEDLLSDLEDYGPQGEVRS